MRKLYSLLARKEGQTMAEYATVLTVITIACLAAFALLAAASSGAITESPNCSLKQGMPGGAGSPIWRSEKKSPGGAATP